MRATEYTVGAKGPQAMPAELPPTSGYTYAAEFADFYPDENGGYGNLKIVNLRLSDNVVSYDARGEAHGMKRFLPDEDACALLAESFCAQEPAALRCAASYAGVTVEKKIGKNPQPPFGQGNIRGVAAPESANNAGAQTSFIPMLTLGIPPNAVMALMIGAMTIHNIQPGPQVMTSNPALFWGLVASMWIGNFMLVILNLPLIGMWVQLLKVPYRLLYPAILVFCAIGVYSINNNAFDVQVTVAFGVLGYVFFKLRCEPAPLILGFILGPMMEENLRRAMLLSRGDPTVFFTRPLSLTLLLMAVALVVIVALPQIKDQSDFHCVTTWSKMDVQWEGVQLSTVIALATDRAPYTVSMNVRST